MPDITGRIGDTSQSAVGFYSGPKLSGAFYDSFTIASGFGLNAGEATLSGCYFAASKSNTIYGSNRTVQPPAITLIPQIKF